MIDLHTHILYGIDDGPKELSESLDMVSAALDAGFTHLVATPHYIHGTEFISTTENNVKLMKQIQDKVALPELLLGSELFYDHLGEEHLKEKRASSINGGKYILVEVPWENMSFTNLLNYIFNLEIAGYSVILAHPERYDFVQKDPNTLASLIKRDVIMQMSLSSLSGRYGRQTEKTARIMLDHNMVHVASSDAHKVEDYKESSEMIDLLSHLVGEEKLEELVIENPSHILSSKVFYPDPPVKLRKRSIFRWIKNKR